jgi:hypothetical protein
MEPNEIIEMLRAEDNCDVLDYINDAADCIERLQAELQNAQIHADCMQARATAFEAEWEESQRRERAAVEDLISVCEQPNMFQCMMMLEKWRGPSEEGE